MTLEFPASPAPGERYGKYVWDDAKEVWGTTAPAPLVERVETLEDDRVLRRVVPTSMSVGSGSGSFSATTGLVTFSASSSISLNGIFTADFVNYELIVRMTSASGGAGTLLRVGVGTTDDTTNYQLSYMEQAGTSAWTGGTSSTFVRFGRADTGGMFGKCLIGGPFQSDRATFFIGEGIDTSGYHARAGGRYATAKSQTRLTLLSELGATFTGTMQVLGVMPA